MITFKQFLREADEVATTTRKSMMHLQSMKPIEFVQWAQSLHSDFNGVLKDLRVTLKVDGLGARFGKDKTGRFFFEGSRTGPVFDTKAFSSYASSKGGNDESVARAGHYDDMFDLLKGSKLLKLVPNNGKVVCEIFYNPMAKEAGDGQVSFVTVKYDKSKLGRVMTLIPISVLDASTGEQHPEARSIMDKLIGASSPDVKVVDARLKAGDIDVKAYIHDMLNLGDRELAVLKSLKAADKPEKTALLAAIQQAKDKLAEYILNHKNIRGKDMLGKDIEGLVLSISDQPIKITTPEFKASKAKK